jgi:hypothetical protein
MRFSERRSATLSVRRFAAQNAWQIDLAGERGHVELCDRGIRKTGRTGESGDFVPSSACVAIADQLGRVAGRETPFPKRLQDMREQHLATLAVIEAGYLSAKTGTPEPPSRFLDF